MADINRENNYLKIKFPTAIQIKRLKNKVHIDKVFTKEELKVKHFGGST